MSDRQEQTSVGWVSGNEALAHVQKARKYADAVAKEVAGASRLPQERRDAWATFYRQLYDWVNVQINRSFIDLELNSADIVQQAQARIDEASAWSREARSSGASASAPTPPAAPSTDWWPKIPNILPTIELGSLAIIALAVLYLAPKRR